MEELKLIRRLQYGLSYLVPLPHPHGGLTSTKIVLVTPHGVPVMARFYPLVIVANPEITVRPKLYTTYSGT